jgi:hypothetical protein
MSGSDKPPAEGRLRLPPGPPAAPNTFNADCLSCGVELHMVLGPEHKSFECCSCLAVHQVCAPTLWRGLFGVIHRLHRIPCGDCAHLIGPHKVIRIPCSRSTTQTRFPMWAGMRRGRDGGEPTRRRRIQCVRPLPCQFPIPSSSN